MEIHDLGSVAPGSGFTICARLKAPSGELLLQADLTQIDLRVIVESAPGTTIATAQPSVADVVYDELQLDGRWSEDKVGYNFAYPTDAGQTPQPATTYLLMFKFTPATGSPFYEYFRVQTLKPKFDP